MDRTHMLVAVASLLVDSSRRLPNEGKDDGERAAWARAADFLNRLYAWLGHECHYSLPVPTMEVQTDRVVLSWQFYLEETCIITFYGGRVRQLEVKGGFLTTMGQERFYDTSLFPFSSEEGQVMRMLLDANVGARERSRDQRAAHERLSEVLVCAS